MGVNRADTQLSLVTELCDCRKGHWLLMSLPLSGGFSNPQQSLFSDVSLSDPNCMGGVRPARAPPPFQAGRTLLSAQTSAKTPTSCPLWAQTPWQKSIPRPSRCRLGLEEHLQRLAYRVSPLHR